MSAPLIHLEAIKKVFTTDEVETHALSEVHLDIARRRIHLHRRALGLREVHPALHPGPAGHAHRRHLRAERQARGRTEPPDRARIRNHEIGFIFQSFNLIGDLTVFENVELPLVYRRHARGERRSAGMEALEEVGMSHRAKHLPSQLSGGQQQRVAVARALAGRPSILLADEPTGNLDSTNGEAVMDLLKDLHRAGSTICMVTHDPRFAQLADRTVHLFDGQIVSEEEARKHHTA